jgi:ABC-type uncharacterized transport system ATPase subunit
VGERRARALRSPAFARRWLVRRARPARVRRASSTRFDVRGAGRRAGHRRRALSGGNMQKLILGEP